MNNNDYRNGYETAKSNSVGTKKKINLAKVKRQSFAKGFLAASVAVILLYGTLQFGNFVKYLTKPESKIEMEYSQIVNDATKRTNDRLNYWYDTGMIVNELTKEPEEMDMKLYFVYKSIDDDNKITDAKKIEHMDDIINQLKYCTKDFDKEYKVETDNFHDYLIKNNFKENNTYSIEKYNKYWKAMVEAKEVISSETKDGVSK
jgi:hypothetical protein